MPTTDATKTQARHAVALAMREEHTGLCSNNTCEIDHLAEAGFVFWAAWILAGATETPILDAATRGIPLRAWAEAEGDEARTHMIDHTRRCRACDSFVWVDRYDTTCGNCLAPVRGRAA